MENRITSKRANNILHREFFSKFTPIQRLCYKISAANYPCLNITCLLGFRKCMTLNLSDNPTVIIKFKSIIRTILLDFLLKSLQLACNLITPDLHWKLFSLLDQMLIRHPDCMNANAHLHLCYAKALTRVFSRGHSNNYHHFQAIYLN